jgi:hypothetical protein
LFGIHVWFLVLSGQNMQFSHAPRRYCGCLFIPVAGSSIPLRGGVARQGRGGGRVHSRRPEVAHGSPRNGMDSPLSYILARLQQSGVCMETPWGPLGGLNLADHDLAD